MKSIFVILFLCLSFGAYADTTPNPTLQQSVADVFSSDPGSDFGQKVINFVAGGGNESYMEASLLSTVSRFINIGALSMMAWLAVLGATTFVIQTGNKGTPGGQVISSFWMPIRISTAVILLVPLSSGYSTLQYGVITIAEKGNSFGNTIQQAGLDWLYQNGTYRAPALQDGSTVILGWVANEVCREYINYSTNYETVGRELRTNTNSPAGIEEFASFRTGYYYDHNEPGSGARTSSPRQRYCGSIEFKSQRNSAMFADEQGDPDLATMGMHAVMPAFFLGEFNGDQYSSGYSGPSGLIKEQERILKTLQPQVLEIAQMILADQDELNELVSQGETRQSAFEQARQEANMNGDSLYAKLQSASRQYNSMMRSAVAKTVNQIIDQKNDKREPWIAEVNKAGWPALGTVFWQQQMSQMQINQLADAFTLVHHAPNVDDDYANDERLAEINARLTGLAKIKREMNEGSSAIAFDAYDFSAIADAGSEGRGFVDGFKDLNYDIVAGAFKGMAFKNGDDPIVNLQYYGTIVGSIAETAYWAKTVVTTGLIMTGAALKTTAEGAKNSADNFLLGLGAIVGAPMSGATAGTNAVFEGMSYFFKEVGPFFNTLILYLIIVGLVLGVVLPTIPLIQWFMGFISWMLFFVECLLVSPMWLAAHGTAEKEGWGTEHTRQGYMLMVGLFLAPALRVAGFFAILLLLRPIGMLMSWMIDYINGVIVAGWVNPFLLLGSMGVVAVFAYTAMVRIFSLPSELFERGLRWINGGQEVTGDSGAEKETRNTIAAFSHKSEAAAGHRGGGQRYQPSAALATLGKKGDDNPTVPKTT